VPDDEDAGAGGVPGRELVERYVHGVGLRAEQLSPRQERARPAVAGPVERKNGEAEAVPKAQQRQVGMRAAVEIGGRHAAAVQREDERPRGRLRLGQQTGQLDGAAPQHDLFDLDGSSS